jgi:hypothetical protein
LYAFLISPMRYTRPAHPIPSSLTWSP